MIIDCAHCPVRRSHCDECIVPTLLDARPGLALDDDEARAVELFVQAGLVSEDEAVAVRARHEPWVGSRAAG